MARRRCRGGHDKRLGRQCFLCAGAERELGLLASSTWRGIEHMVCGDAPQCRSLTRRQVRAKATPKDRYRRRSRRATRRRPQCWPSRSAPSAGHAAGAPLWSLSGRARWRALRLARCPSRSAGRRRCFFFISRCPCSFARRAARRCSARREAGV